MTFKQARELGANVRKGEKGTRIVYANTFTPKGEDNADNSEDEERRRIGFLRFYTVFNTEQIENLPKGKFPAPTRPNLIQNNDAQSRELDQFFAAYGVSIEERSGSGAYYRAGQTDRITMPLFASFRDATAFYATLAHEAIHSTGHDTRLNRDTLRTYFDNRASRPSLSTMKRGSCPLKIVDLRMDDISVREITGD